MTYNRADSDIYKTAEELSKLFEKRITKIKKTPAGEVAAQAGGVPKRLAIASDHFNPIVTLRLCYFWCSDISSPLRHSVCDVWFGKPRFLFLLFFFIILFFKSGKKQTPKAIAKKFPSKNASSSLKWSINCQANNLATLVVWFSDNAQMPWMRSACTFFLMFLMMCLIAQNEHHIIN